MNFIENVKSGVSAAVETLSDAAQNLIEKNRVNAQLNRLKLVIKNESAILDKAYIQLGKYYFENFENPQKESAESIFEIISNSRARLKKAEELYRSILKKQTEEVAAESETVSEPFVDAITVACSNEDEYDAPSESASSTADGFDNDDGSAEKVLSEAAEEAAETAEKAFDAAEEFAETVNETVKEVAERTGEAFEETVEEVTQTAEETVEAIEEAAEDGNEAF